MSKIEAKIHTWESLKEKCKEWQQNGHHVVFTNGCFDIIHKGHVHYLEEASALGDKLIIGVNSDLSIRKLKGENRPIQNEVGRLAVLSAMESVAAVVLFEEETPEELIQHLVPDILVKGGDWKIDEIAGADFVLKNGGKIKSLSFVEGYSTTSIEQKILKQCL